MYCSTNSSLSKGIIAQAGGDFYRKEKSLQDHRTLMILLRGFYIREMGFDCVDAESTLCIIGYIQLPSTSLRDASESWGTLPRAKKCPPDTFCTSLRTGAALSSPIRALKNPDVRKDIRIFWCERWDSNPHGITTRTSNVLVYHSNTLASA